MSSVHRGKVLGFKRLVPTLLKAYVGGSVVLFFLALCTLIVFNARLMSGELSMTKTRVPRLIIGRLSSNGRMFFDDDGKVSSLRQTLNIGVGLALDERTLIDSYGQFTRQKIQWRKVAQESSEEEEATVGKVDYNEKITLAAGWRSEDSDLLVPGIDEQRGERVHDKTANWSRDIDGVDFRSTLTELTAIERQQWLVHNWNRFKILADDEISKVFPLRMKCFFRGTHGCQLDSLSSSAVEGVVDGEIAMPQLSSGFRIIENSESQLVEKVPANLRPQSSVGVPVEEQIDEETVGIVEARKKIMSYQTKASRLPEGILKIGSGDYDYRRGELDTTTAQEVVRQGRTAFNSSWMLGSADLEVSSGTDILENNLTSRSGRTNSKCSGRFFMTWISPISSFGPREHLSLESVFKTYPSACVVLLSRSLDNEDGRQLLRPFLQRGFRVMAVAPSLPYLFKDTPAQWWFQNLRKGDLDPGEISFSQNLSNILRLAVLHKYGGAYLDTDVIMLKRLPRAESLIGAQSADKNSGHWTRLNNAVLVFPKHSPIMHKLIKEFALTFNGSKWGHNGPYLVTRVLQRFASLKEMGCTVLGPAALYPVNWIGIRALLQFPKSDQGRHQQLEMLEKLEKRSYAIHLWNKQTRQLPMERGSVIDIIYRQRCVFCKESTLIAALDPQPPN